MNADEIGARLARRIFEVGGDPTRPAHRIEFKHQRAGQELPMGGFAEKPLAEFIARELERLGVGKDGER